MRQIAGFLDDFTNLEKLSEKHYKCGCLTPDTWKQAKAQKCGREKDLTSAGPICFSEFPGFASP
jgi:hypothetical protein